MIAFLLRKMWNNKWMMLSLLVGNILLIGIVSSAPLYTHATMQRILLKDLQQSQIDRNVYPTTIEFKYSFNYVELDKIVPNYYSTRDTRLPELIDLMGVPLASNVLNLNMESWVSVPTLQREERPRARTTTLSAYEGYEEHITLTQGRMPSDKLEGDVIEVLANETTMIRQDFLLNELFTVANMPKDGPEYKIQVVGVFENKNEQDLYWTTNPNLFNNVLLVSPQLVNDYFVANYYKEFKITSRWILMLDYNQMNVNDVPQYISADAALKAQYNESKTNKNVWSYKENFISTINGYSQRTEKLNITIWVLQVPIYVLLAFYIFMVSKQILTIEQNDISVLKSRGASRKQLLLLYLMQSLFVTVVSLLTGVPLGMLICRMLGASNGFLNLVQRAALEVVLTPDTLLFAGLAAFLSVLTMLVPVIQFSRVTIVDYKRSKSGRPKKSLWQRFFLDVLCFGVACYGLYSFNSNREIMARATTEVQSVDPLLFASSSLFIIGLGLICLRLFPYLIRLVFLLGRRFWQPSVYASLLRVIRSAGDEQFIMIFLVFTLAIGIFNAKAARTINLNNDEKIHYQVGADLVIEEEWPSNLYDLLPASDTPRTPELMRQVLYREPDFARFTAFEEVEAAAKVLEQSGTLRRGNDTFNNVQMMAVETDTFGQALWYREDLLPVHINYYLNVLARRTDGVLLSSNFKSRHNVSIGDTITFRDDIGNDVRGIVYGFVDHWPSYTAVENAVARSGEVVQEDRYLVVANLGHITSVWGQKPYRVWMKTNTSSNNFFYEYAEANGLRITAFKDAKAQVVESKSDPIMQGTNGVLTVGFIVTLLVCCTGFLIYWILSIKSRVLQFGIFRAMGMTMRNIIVLLVDEQIFITLTAVVIGAAVGEIASRLFVPLIQISFTASEQVIPLKIIIEQADYVNLFSVVGLMIAACLLVLGVIISQIKIAQALKLGED